MCCNPFPAGLAGGPPAGGLALPDLTGSAVPSGRQERGQQEQTTTRANCPKHLQLNRDKPFLPYLSFCHMFPALCACSGSHLATPWALKP